MRGKVQTQYTELMLTQVHNLLCTSMLLWITRKKDMGMLKKELTLHMGHMLIQEPKQL